MSDDSPHPEVSRACGLLDGERPAPERAPLPVGARKFARIVVPNLFLISAVAAAVIALPFLGIGGPQFNHHYVKVPPNVGVVPVGQSIGVVPFANVVGGLRVQSLSELSQVLNPGVLTASGTNWTLHQPVVIAGGSRLILRGPGRLTLAPGSFLEVSLGGRASITNLSIVGTGTAARRGFLFDSAGLLVLNHDDIQSLGRLATFATGVTFANAQPGSGVLNSVIIGNTDGVYAVATSGLVLQGNVISSSVLDGIYLRDQVSNLTVNANTVTTSGFDAIAVENAGVHIVIAQNTVTGAARYGILLYNNVHATTIRANHLSGAIDGVVVNSTTRASIAANTISGEQRFGIRLSGPSLTNDVRRNQLAHCAVGIYLTSGATRNAIELNRFSSNGENIRVRLSAPDNFVHPHPTNSEIAAGR